MHPLLPQENRVNSPEIVPYRFGGGKVDNFFARLEAGKKSGHPTHDVRSTYTDPHFL